MQMKLKIGILGTRGIPNAYGGFEEFAEHLAEGLVQRGHEVYVYNSSLHPYKENRWKGVHLVHCPDHEDRLGTAGQFFYDFNCIKDARKRNYDILLQLGYTSNSVWHRLWPKTAINIVNMDGLEWKRTKYSRVVRQFLKKAERWAAEHASYLVADSPCIQQYISDSYERETTFIPYAADPFVQPNPTLLKQFQLQAYEYYLAVSRMEPENSVEMIIEGYLASKKDHKLILVGNLNKQGTRWKTKYADKKIEFVGAVFDKSILNNLRYFSKLHFHGHSVGGTNPSLLEAMACRSNIAAHDNIFNRTVLGNDAAYFSNREQISYLLDSEYCFKTGMCRQEANLEKIRHLYNWQKVTDAYEKLMLEAIHRKRGGFIPQLSHPASSMHGQ
jgi:glycosyltransferase involved in cell wall biosynthesis